MWRLHRIFSWDSSWFPACSTSGSTFPHLLLAQRKKPALLWDSTQHRFFYLILRLFFFFLIRNVFKCVCLGHYSISVHLSRCPSVLSAFLRLLSFPDATWGGVNHSSDALGVTSARGYHRLITVRPGLIVCVGVLFGRGQSDEHAHVRHFIQSNTVTDSLIVIVVFLPINR